MSLLSSLFKSKKELPAFDFAAIGVDMHSHLLPSIDDGSQSLDQSIGMLLKFRELGYRKVITTPHIMQDFYRNTPEIIYGKLAELKSELERLKIDIELEAAAEYYFDETLIEKIRNRQLLTFGDQYVLFEFSFSNLPSHTDTLFFEFQSNGYKPVLAHFERYPYYHRDPMIAQLFRDQGVRIQLNLNSLLGHYGPAVEKQAKFLVDNGLVDFVGSDCHRIDHLLLLQRNRTHPYLHKLEKLKLQNQSL
jgi:protein-tyrosine phosphatase